MCDVLYKAALSFSNIINYDYIYTLGDSKRNIRISVLSSNESEFTHIYGIDHLTDVPKVIGMNSKQKRAIYKNILNKKIKFSDLEDSSEFDMPLKGTFNEQTKSPYTIRERILSLQEIEHILDTSFRGNIFKWDVKRSNIAVSDGENRRVLINADYVLVVPSERHPKENYYFFLYRTNKECKCGDIQLNLFSAFADCIDLTCGQVKPYTILKEVKREIKTNKESLLYIHKSYRDTMT